MVKITGKIYVRFLEAAIGIEPMNKAFAELCLTTWLRRHAETAKAKVKR